MDQQDRDVGGGNACYAGGLAYSCGAEAIQLFAGFVFEGSQFRIGEVGGDGALFQAVSAGDLGFLLGYIACVFGRDLGSLNSVVYDRVCQVEIRDEDRQGCVGGFLATHVFEHGGVPAGFG